MHQIISKDINYNEHGTLPPVSLAGELSADLGKTAARLSSEYFEIITY